MKILLVGNYPNDRQESMRRFTTLMQEGLTKAGHQAKVIRPAVFVGRVSPGVHGWRKWLGYVDKFVIFPARLRAAAGWADIVHICDHSNAVYARWVGSTPCVVTCHDMLAVRGALGEQTDCPASWAGRHLQRWIVRGLRRADALVSVSSATSVDVQQITGVPAHRRKVVLNALNYPYRRISHEESSGRLSHIAELNGAAPFVLHVGSNLARKNREGVIRAVARASREIDCRLVLAGPPLTPQLHELIRTAGVTGRVTVVVKPSNEELEALYNRALALFFPSRYEGFGWPLIEAQACGCPVICSRCAPFAEVVGATAITRHADDEIGFAADIVRLAQDAAEREAWAAKSLKNAGRFDPERMIAGYLDVYREFAKRP